MAGSRQRCRDKEEHLLTGLWQCRSFAKARAPETNVSAYRLGCHDDRGMGKALLELPSKWRAREPTHAQGEHANSMQKDPQPA
ncbi:hypothetical protein ATANTOWER_006005 [Ataeniobius toweri]|uniref:Uncharacterized protein n=1 Tax=Ataeniobius toweri TaxID=208326 RepID=A0ABU7AYN3_9TELE|nr:hypothetical protein [Ataeniobius toweri]